MQCPQCHAENPDQAKFCLDAAPASRRAAPNVGRLPPAAKFCFECGAKLGLLPGALTGPALLTARRASEAVVPKSTPSGCWRPRGRRWGPPLVTILFSDVKSPSATVEKLIPKRSWR